MISVEQAIDKLVTGLSPLPKEQVALANALGRVLAEDVASRVTHPPVAVSAMDGYAVRVADVAGVPVSLDVIGESAAGHPFDGAVASGQAVRIFTGAAVPKGADTIVIQEDTERDPANHEGIVKILEAPKPGQFVRAAGLDFREGQVLLESGRVLTARDVSLAAAMNVPWLKVRRKPRVAFVATGDEVVMPGDPLKPDQILSSNSVAVAAYVTALGGEPVSLGIAPDEPDALKEILAGAKGADLLVTTGGASVGDHDLVQSVLGDQGFELGFYKVAMRPGKPLIFGNVAGVPVLGLPGNPVSTGVTSALMLKAAMETLLGLPVKNTPETAVVTEDLPENGKRQDYLRAVWKTDGDGRAVAPYSRQDSSMLATFAHADCLIVRPPHAPAAKAGTPVPVLPLGFGPIRF